jgi:hypothetical protein
VGKAQFLTISHGKRKAAGKGRLGEQMRGFTMRAAVVFALCIISGATGAGIDHYWNEIVLAAQTRTGLMQTAAPPSDQKKETQVLGNRVRCDVRFSELHLPEEEYRSFFDRCMGNDRSAHAQ